MQWVSGSLRKWSSERFPSSLICKCILVYACIDQCYTYRSALNTDSGCIEVRLTHQEVMATDKGPGTLHFPRSAPSHTVEYSSLSKYTTLALSAKRFVFLSLFVLTLCARTQKLVCTQTVLHGPSCLKITSAGPLRNADGQNIIWA